MNGFRHSHPARRKVVLIDTPEKRLAPYSLVLESSGVYEVIATLRYKDIRTLAQITADVVLLHVTDDADAVRVIRSVKDAAPFSELVILAGSLDAARVSGILKAGANGLISAESSLLEFADAMVNVVNRGAAITPDVARIVVMSFHAFGGSELLGQRERQVLGLLADGLTSPEMAVELGISVETVKTHVKNIYKKFGVRKRSEAIACARAARILPVQGK